MGIDLLDIFSYCNGNEDDAAMGTHIADVPRIIAGAKILKNRALNEALIAIKNADSKLFETFPINGILFASGSGEKDAIKVFEKFNKLMDNKYTLSKAVIIQGDTPKSTDIWNYIGDTEKAITKGSHLLEMYLIEDWKDNDQFNRFIKLAIDEIYESLSSTIRTMFAQLLSE